MDDVQVGSIIRAVRIRRGMTQAQVGAAAGVSRPMVSLIECGGFERTPLCAVRRVAGALGVSLRLAPRWRGAELAKLLDERHAVMVREVVRRLTAMGWQALPEHSFNVRGEQGSIDVLAWHPLSHGLLSVEVKTKLADLQDLLSKMDRKRRLAPTLARELGWRPLVVGSVLVLPGQTWARNAVDRFGPIFGSGSARADSRHPSMAEATGPRPPRRLVSAQRHPGSTKPRPGGSIRVRPRRMGLPTATPRSNLRPETGVDLAASRSGDVPLT